jgi:putative DNA primase/helicase
VGPARKMLGTCRGGAVRLAPVGPRLALCEGIETGLSIRQVCPDLPVWCALSAGNLDRLQLPAEVEEVVLVADGDPAGLAAAQRAAERYGASGRRIRLVELPAGMDANDVLQLGAAAA